MNHKIIPILLGLSGVLLGFLVAQQLHLKTAISEVTDPNKTAVIALEVQELIKNDKILRDELVMLEKQEKDFQNTSTNQAAKEVSIKDEIAQLQIITGQTVVHGPGVEVKFTRHLELTQLADLVNALRNIGAEAIAINNQRITAVTAISANQFSAPYSVQAIGKTDILSSALSRRGGILEQIGDTGMIDEKADLVISTIKTNK